MKDIDYKAGDTIIAKEGTFLIVSAEGFSLTDGELEAKYILINAAYGSMEAYCQDLNEIWKYYHIIDVIQNPRSFERSGGILN